MIKQHFYFGAQRSVFSLCYEIRWFDLNEEDRDDTDFASASYRVSRAFMDQMLWASLEDSVTHESFYENL